MKKIIDFLKEMVSDSNKVSSKRFWGSILMTSAVILSYIKILDSCDDLPPNKLYLITSMYLFGSICLGLGIFDKVRGSNLDKTDLK